MNIDIGLYRVNKTHVKRLIDTGNYDLTKSKNISRIVSEIGISTNCPVIAVLYYIGELNGFSDILNEYIDEINSFYGYETIEGKLDAK